nr:hypothetical protein [Candidatus Sigynarchaeota archaeon]
MATIEPDADPDVANINALLAARQPRSAVAVMIAVLSKSVATFASTASMVLPDGDVLEKISSVLSRAAVACRNSSISARIHLALPLLHLAHAQLSTKISDPGVRLLTRAFFSVYPLLASPELARLVRFGAVIIAATTGRSALALASQKSAENAEPGKSRRFTIEPMIAGALFCGVSGAWTAIGVLSTLNLSRGITCGIWLLIALILFKIRNVERVKVLTAKLRDPSAIGGKTLAIGGCAAIALVSPLAATTITTIQLGTQVSTTDYASLVTLLLDPGSSMLLLAVKACTVGIIGAAIAAAILAIACCRDKDNAGKMIQNHAAARLAMTAACICAWIAILALFSAEGVWFPGVTWTEGTETLGITVSFAWYALGFLGIIAA